MMNSDPEFVARKRRQRMDQIDNLPPETRRLVHDYGYYVVKSFIDLGVTKPKHIAHLVGVVLDEFSPTRASYSNQGISTNLNRVSQNA